MARLAPLYQSVSIRVCLLNKLKKMKGIKMEKIVEEWKYIEGCPHYEVSNLGQVRYDGLKKNKFGHYHKPMKILAQRTKKNGYRLVSLEINKETKSFNVHRLVAKAFIPNPENKKTVNHKNGDKTDNRVSNLEWMTHKENWHHYLDNRNLFEKIKTKG